MTSHPDTARLAGARPSRVADLVSLVSDPGIVVGAVVFFVGQRASPGWLGLRWSALTLLFSVVLPYAVLALLVRSGRVADRQVVRREQRRVPATAAIACLMGGITLLRASDAPRPLMALMLALFLGLLVIAGLNVFTKVSVHTGTAAGAIAVLVVEIGWVALCGLALVVLVGWARARAGRHTVGQVLAGAAIGALVTGLAYGVGRGPDLGAVAGAAGGMSATAMLANIGAR